MNITGKPLEYFTLEDAELAYYSGKISFEELNDYKDYFDHFTNNPVICEIFNNCLHNDCSTCPHFK